MFPTSWLLAGGTIVKRRAFQQPLQPCPHGSTYLWALAPEDPVFAGAKAVAFSALRLARLKSRTLIRVSAIYEIGAWF
jgi:hypothetical protein